MPERRRWPRKEVAWSVAMSIDGGPTINARAVDASRYGLRLAFQDPADLSAIQNGARCQVEVHLSGGEARFVRVCEVRYLGQNGVGLVFAVPLPTALVPAATPETPSADATKPKGRRASSLMSMLRSVALAPLQH